MSSTIKYVQIFNLNIFHNYFLDKKDTTDTDTIIVFDDTQKTEDLSSYNVSDFLRITPSQDTKRILANHKVVFKTTTDGATCFISVDQDSKPIIDSTGVTVDLLIYSRDTFLEKYTDMDTNSEGIYFFTNDTAEPTNSINTLDTVPATDLELYKVAASTDPMSKYQTLVSSLTGREQRSLLGIVSIQLDTLLDGTGAVVNPTEFKVVLKNRKTVWVYLNDDGTVAAETATAQPFMNKGNITPRDASNVVIPYRMATPFDAFAFQTDPNQPIKTQVYI